MKIIHAYTHLDRIGGAETMVVRLYDAMRKAGRDAYIAAGHSYTRIHPRYKKIIPQRDYIPLTFRYPAGKDILFISHHRKLTTYYLLGSPGRKRRTLHIAHNEFDSLKYFTLFPDRVVAVSEGVKKNLTDYFGLSADRIQVIYNAVPDPGTAIRRSGPHTPLRILYPARVNSVKRQLELVRFIRQSGIRDIELTFCGNGDLLGQLQEETRGDARFRVLGMVENMPEQYAYTDVVMLYTEREGLPVSLIEAGAYALPVVCNDVGGNAEIVRDAYNGFIVHSYRDLGEKIQYFLHADSGEYQTLSRHARERFERQFKMEVMTKAYLELIDKMTAR